ncbi:MAG: DUF6622 family protein [Lautropia sp.]
MLIQLLIDQPDAALTIVRYTPHWVWGLLGGLLLLGATQLRTRRIPLARALAPAIGLALFSLFGLLRDLAGSGWLWAGLPAWLAGAGAMLALGWRRAPRGGTAWDAASRRLTVPGSVAPLATIAAIFVFKYAIGVELALQPDLRQQALFAVATAGCYGALAGWFAIRPIALWRLTRRNAMPSAAASPRAVTALASVGVPSLALLLAIAAPADGHAQVGMRTLQVDDRPLTLVYPTPVAAQATWIGPFRIEIAPDAPLAAGSHRLVVMSHGTGGSALADHALAAALARAGFVVAQLEHEGDNWRDQRLAGPESFRRRPLEVVRAIDALAAHPQWADRLDLDRVGVHGMSAGGVTAMALAGAQWRVLTLIRHCNAHLDDDPAFCLQGAATADARTERTARYEAARGVPDAFLPAPLRALHGGRTPSTDAPDPGFDPRPDPRIAAVSVAVPVGAIFTPESLARVRVPVGVVLAERDRWLVPRFHGGHLLAHCGSCTSLADLPGAGHMDLLRPWPGAIAEQLVRAQGEAAATTPGLDPALLDDAHARIVAFHLAHLVAPR